jgi:hypothetical protein
MVSNNVVDFKNPKLAKKLRGIEDRRNTSLLNFDLFLNRIFSIIF